MPELTQHYRRCQKPLWFRSGMPGGVCGKQAFGEQKYRREYSVCGMCCEAHGGPTLKETITGKTVIRFDGPPGPESGRFVEAERDGKSINAGDWIQDGNDWLLVLRGDGRKEAVDA